ncbi:hypothetical protein SK128_024787 [Halocaridina rubra]|uniref:Uncharacterized protein n=1 Tax=Halocaridina rubra TaxID=373956 RepID=A0AAN9A138_HALRR
MEGVVRLMLKIKHSDPEAKVLVFSTWNDVLDVIGDAFAQNGITYRALHQHSKFQRHNLIDSLSSSPTMSVCHTIWPQYPVSLLLPGCVKKIIAMEDVEMIFPVTMEC